MNRNQVYIISNIVDDADNAYYEYMCRKYAVRAKSLRRMGYIPVNPMNIIPRNSNWQDAVNICIPIMLSCSYISPLPDTWYSSSGIIQFNIARSVGKQIIIPNKEPEIDNYEKYF